MSHWGLHKRPAFTEFGGMGQGGERNRECLVSEERFPSSAVLDRVLEEIKYCQKLERPTSSRKITGDVSDPDGMACGYFQSRKTGSGRNPTT